MDKRTTFCVYASALGLKPKSGGSLLVTVTKSDNPHFTYPVTGVVKLFEVGSDLQITTAVFHELRDNGELGAPCVMDNIEFTYKRMW